MVVMPAGTLPFHFGPTIMQKAGLVTQTRRY